MMTTIELHPANQIRVELKTLIIRDPFCLTSGKQDAWQSLHKKRKVFSQPLVHERWQRISIIWRAEALNGRHAWPAFQRGTYPKIHQVIDLEYCKVKKTGRSYAM